jgi:two-component system, LytTR family, sensor kinase
MKKFWQYVFPALFGLLIYTTIRVVNDSMSTEQFWDRSIFQNAVEIVLSILTAYAFNGIMKFFIKRSNRKKENYRLKSVLKEFGTVCLASSILINAVLYIIHFLINDPVSFADFVIANVVAVLYVLLFYSIARGNQLIKNYIEQQTQIEKMKNENLQTELKFLKAQYHPHFLFNALNTIYFQMDDDVPGAKRTVEKFSALLRYQLYDQQALVSVHKELNHLKNFVDLQKERISERLNFEWKVDASLQDGKIYPLLLLPLVENAFKYVGGRYEISVAASKEKDRICFIVRNSTCKKQQNNEAGIGLENLKRRLTLLYPNNHSFIAEGDENIFIAELKIPLL